MFKVLINGVASKWEYGTRKEANEWVKRVKKINDGLRRIHGMDIAPVTTTYSVREEP